MTEPMMISPATKEDEKLRIRRVHVLQPREVFATGDQLATKDCARQIGSAS